MGEAIAHALRLAFAMYEAEAHLTQLLAQVQAGNGIPSTRLRLGEFLDQWLRDYAESNVGPVTLQNYQDTVRVHIKPGLGGHIPLSRLSPPMIQRYLSQKLREEGLSTTSLRYHYSILHESLGHAVRWGLLMRNPCDAIEPPRRRQTEMRVLDEEQVRLFLAEAKRSSRLYCLYLTAILTGMRLGELLGLRWKDLNLTPGVMLRQGENPKVVQEGLGHSTPAFTLAVYSHVLPGMQNEAARRLEERLLGRVIDSGE
jgi:integrase